MSPRLRKAMELVDAFFEGREDAAMEWWLSSNPLLGNVTPMSLVEIGREHVVIEFIETQIEEDNRRGFRQTLDGLDRDVRVEFMKSLAEAIEKAMKEKPNA